MVRDYMTPHPETIGGRDLLSAAHEKMERGRFRRLPVVDAAGALIAIVTDRDLQRHAGYWPSTHVDAAMVENPITIRSDRSVSEAARLMLDNKIGGLPVVDDGRLIGIVTTSDLLRALLNPADSK
ncbi:MAG TPA: CBS domain-containing protein [Candidatus Binatia bacterium]|nr:CBS domain-containing protein [Candidatus Binatia bacterium]